MIPKEIIAQIKDYADCADASYAMLHFVEQKRFYLFLRIKIDKVINQTICF